MATIFQYELLIEKSIYDVLQILDRNLTHKILLTVLFDKPKLKISKIRLVQVDQICLTLNYVHFFVDIGDTNSHINKLWFL